MSSSSDTQGHMLFPSVGWQVTSQVLHLLSVTILAHYISRRIRLEDIKSYHGLSQISWPRALIVLTFIDSWAFLFTSGILVGGAGMELNSTVCNLGVLSCIIFYATSKLFIYLFLAEKVYVVWSPTPGRPRFRSPVYLTCFFVVMLYLVVGVNMIYARIAYFRDDGACVIGLRRAGSLVLLSYDLAINVFLTGMFLYPLIRERIRNLHIRRVGHRAIVAAVVALTSSCINILVLTLLHGTELAWVCLGSCGLDVVVNSTALFWVTSGTSLRPMQSQAREVMAAGTDGPFKANGAFICVSPKGLHRLSLQRSIQLDQVSLPSGATIPFPDDTSPPKLDSLHLSLSPIPDWNHDMDDSKRSDDEDGMYMGLDDIERPMSAPVQPPRSLITLPDRARTPGRTIRPFLLFRRRHTDWPSDLQVNITTQTEVGRDSTLYPSPSPRSPFDDSEHAFDMFERIPPPLSRAQSTPAIPRPKPYQWNPGGSSFALS